MQFTSADPDPAHELDDFTSHGLKPAWNYFRVGLTVFSGPGRVGHPQEVAVEFCQQEAPSVIIAGNEFLKNRQGSFGFAPAENGRTQQMGHIGEFDRGQML